jgi:hypothetical protein
MKQELIKVHDLANSKMIDLLAEFDKNGEVTKMFDYNGNELKVNFLRDEVYFKKTWWHFDKKQPVQR